MSHVFTAEHISSPYRLAAAVLVVLAAGLRSAPSARNAPRSGASRPRPTRFGCPTRRWCSAPRPPWSTSMPPRRSPVRNPLARRPDLPALLRGAGRPGGPGEQVQRSLGSGVLVDASGPRGHQQPRHRGSGPGQGVAVRQARIRSRDRAQGFALGPGGVAHQGAERALSRASSSLIRTRLQVGDLVLAIGNPFAVGQTVTHGIVSAVARTQVGITDYQFFIQTDAAINPGNSGGALVDLGRHAGRHQHRDLLALGRLAGHRLRHSRQHGAGWWSPPPGAAAPSVKRPWLGAKLQAVTPEIAESLGLKRPSGALIASVTPASPAARAGLQDQRPDHRHRRPGRSRTRTPSTTASRPRRSAAAPSSASCGPAGRLSLNVALEAAPETPHDELVIASSLAVPGCQGVQPVAGARGRPAARSHGAKASSIVDIANGSPAQSLGFQRGDLVLSVNNAEDRQDPRSRTRRRPAEPALAHHHRARRPADVGGVRRMTPPRAKRAEAEPVRGRGPRARRAAPAGRPAAADAAGRGGRSGSSARARRRAHAHAGHPHARLADLLGPARHRQDHGGAPSGAGDRPAFRADLGDLLRRRRPQEGVRGRARAARDRAGDAALRRRDPSLQPRAAGFASCR